MKFKQYLNERTAKQIKKEWEKWSIKRQNLLGRGKSKEYKEARKKELELAHEYWKLTGFEFEGLGQLPFESIKEGNNSDFDLLNGIRLAFNIRKANEFFLSLASQSNISDKQVSKAKEILSKTREMKKLIKLAKSMTPEEAMDISQEKLAKRDIRDMKYYSFLSSPLHHEMLKGIK